MIPLDELRTYLGLPEDDDTEAAVLLELERNALAFVQTQARRYFGPPAPVTEYLAGTGSRSLWLSDVPLEPEEPADPEDDPTPRVLVLDLNHAAAAATPLEDFDLRVADERDAALVRHGALRWSPLREYAVTYQRGYREGEEPGDIRQLVLDLVSVKFALRGSEGLRSESMGGYSYTRIGETDMDAATGGWATIHAWRRPVFA
jgi:hypothetical protein